MDGATLVALHGLALLMGAVAILLLTGPRPSARPVRSRPRGPSRDLRPHRRKRPWRPPVG